MTLYSGGADNPDPLTCNRKMRQRYLGKDNIKGHRFLIDLARKNGQGQAGPGNNKYRKRGKQIAAK